MTASSVSDQEIQSLVKIGVQEAKLDILVDDFKEHKLNEEKRLLSLDNNMREIFALIRTFPDKISTCRNDLEKDIQLELEKHYATEATLRIIETELNAKIDKISNRFKWTTGFIVCAAGVVQFLTTMYFMSLQISKLIGS